MGTFLVGQDRIERALTRALSTDRLAHGLLFSGPSGVGRERAARGLAAALLCENRSTPAASLPWGCGTCRGCRRVLAGNHPDVHVLMPEAEAVHRGLQTADGKKRPSPDILVDAVRELAGRMHMAAYEGGARVAIVLDAHRMNVNAQNALLKTLEEPAPGSFIVLLVPHERTVLPTIASRCLRLAFAPLSTADVVSVLRAQGVADAEVRAPLGHGSVGRALAADPLAPSTGTDELMRALLEGSAADRLDAAEALGKERADVDTALGGLEARLAQTIRSDAGGTASPPGWRRAAELLVRVGATREAIGQNASVQLCLEELLLADLPRGLR